LPLCKLLNEIIFNDLKLMENFKRETIMRHLYFLSNIIWNVPSLDGWVGQSYTICKSEYVPQQDPITKSRGHLHHPLEFVYFPASFSRVYLRSYLSWTLDHNFLNNISGNRIIAKWVIWEPPRAGGENV